MKYGNMSQEMILKGVIGEVDGCKIVKVPSSRLPAGCAFILTHPIAATAPKQLEEYKTHDNPPGISGWLVEGRFIYDCFVLNEKADAIFYHGSQPVLKMLNVMTAATDAGKSTVIVAPGAPETGNSWMYQVATDAKALTIPAHGTAIDTGEWTALSASGAEIVAAADNHAIAVVEVDGENKPLAYGKAVLNIG